MVKLMDSLINKFLKYKYILIQFLKLKILKNYFFYIIMKTKL